MVASPFRRIVTELPVPESIAILDEINRLEPRLRAQMPTVWDRAEGAQVYDGYGNVWLDWTSGILTANAGHSAPQVVAAVVEQAKHGVLHSYRFPRGSKLNISARSAALQTLNRRCWLLQVAKRLKLQ